MGAEPDFVLEIDCLGSCLYVRGVDADGTALPVLMRGAGLAYAAAVRQALAEVGYDDLPRDGAFVLSVIAPPGVPLGTVIERLGISKQAAGALVDKLADRNYLRRVADPWDRRQHRVRLTARGADAAAVIRGAVEQVDAKLVARVGEEYLAHTLATLTTLIADA
jgi:DNA-binding MarR family transcriptional regulator